MGTNYVARIIPSKKRKKELVDAIENRYPAIIAAYEARLKEKIASLLEDGQIDESRLAGAFSMVDDRYITIPGNHIEKYGKYLDMLLMTVSKNTKLYRIMDLIQINMKGSVRQDFMIADHYTGFIMNADVSKKSHASIAPSSSADIRMTHTYIRQSATR